MSRVMVVTGASRGIGAAIARAAGEAGWDVAVNYFGSPESAEAVVAEVRSSGRNAVAIRADMGRDADVARLFHETDRALGSVSALVNNAGINHMAPITAFEPADFNQLFAVNVRGAMAACREAARRMAGRGGVIVNVSSVSARTGGGPNGTLYAASKGALDAFTRGLAKELAPEGVRVCGVRPGMTATDIFDNNIGREAAEKSAANRVPLARMADPSEIAAMVVWLCSERASYVTGTSFDVAGGL